MCKRLSLAIAAIMVQMSASAAVIENRPALTLEGAKAVAKLAAEYAQSKNAPGGAIAVVDAGGSLLYLERLDGTFLNASDISIGKARTAVLFGKPTRVFEDIVNQGRYAMLGVPAVAPFTPLQGGVPVRLNGHVVGAVGVSGASNAAQDDEIASTSAAAFETQNSVQVTVTPRSEVDAAFARDATLVSTDSYRVNASKRDHAGEAEVHAVDTDVFYVLEGSATVVTGGSVVEPRTISIDEIRGLRIDGGEEHRIGKGDVVTIPSGIPHWFKSVNTPFKYYVVKVK